VSAFFDHIPPFTFIEDNEGVASMVPIELWRDWIPDNLRTQGGIRKIRRYVKLGQNVGLGITKLKLPISIRHEWTRFPYTIPGVIDPDTPLAREAKLRESIKNHPKFQPPPENPWPYYRRYGYDSVEEFLDGFSWECNYYTIADKPTLVCIGRRREYSIRVPIVDPVTQNLLFNLFPVAGQGLVQVTKLRDNDDRLFLTVN
jgi:hypothetical protein